MASDTAYSSALFEWVVSAPERCPNVDFWIDLVEQVGSFQLRRSARTVEDLNDGILIWDMLRKETSPPLPFSFLI